MALNKRLILADVTGALDHIQDGLATYDSQIAKEYALQALGVLMKLEQELKDDLGV